MFSIPCWLPYFIFHFFLHFFLHFSLILIKSLLVPFNFTFYLPSFTQLSPQSLFFFCLLFSFLLYLTLLLMIPSFSLIFLYFEVLPATKDDPRQRKPDITTAKTDRKSTRLNSSHRIRSRMPSSA